jgi:hypothetical protein
MLKSLVELLNIEIVSEPGKVAPRKWGVGLNAGTTKRTS